MKSVLLVALLALSAFPLVPTAAAADACSGNPDRVALCQTGCCGRDCYDVYVLGDSVYGFCIAPSFADGAAAADGACQGNREVVAVCEYVYPGYNCYDVYVLGNDVLHPCVLWS